MRLARLWLKQHRLAAAALVAIALFMKILVPAGFMPVLDSGSIAIELCSGFGPEPMAMAMPGMGDHRDKDGHPGRSEAPCGFAGHAPPAMAGADPTLLAIAIAFAVAMSFRAPIAQMVRRVRHLRPHLRGPPAP